jgi:hypothetical protein
VTRPWAVNAADAYASWFGRHRPSEGEELALASWLVSLEDSGPPAASASGLNRTAVTASGHTVTFRVFETTESDTVSGYIYVLDID